MIHYCYYLVQFQNEILALFITEETSMPFKIPQLFPSNVCVHVSYSALCFAFWILWCIPFLPHVKLQTIRNDNVSFVLALLLECSTFSPCVVPMSTLQSWADAFRSTPSLGGVVHVYDDLRKRGLEFPMTDLDALSPIHTPNRVRRLRLNSNVWCNFFDPHSHLEPTSHF